MTIIQRDIHHHPAAEQLSEYIAGTLPLSKALCIATHIDNCVACQQQLVKLQAIGASQFAELSEEPISKGLKSQVLSAIKGADIESNDEKKVPPSYIPRPLQKLIPDGFSALEWKKVTADVAMSKLITEPNGTQIALVKVKPGGNMAHHSHTSEEITVVLKGSFSDEDGTYHQGDYLFRDSDHKHKPVATNDQSCICLILLDGPIQLTGFFSSLLNPILRLNHRMS